MAQARSVWAMNQRGKQESVTYSMDQEDEVSEIFSIISTVSLSIHVERLQISGIPQKQNE